MVLTRDLEFQIPGASYGPARRASNLRDGNSTHLLGNLRMQTDVSHAATGFKSILLKPLIPFFQKRNGRRRSSPFRFHRKTRQLQK